MQHGLKFPGLKGRIFYLSFEKHNDYKITGIIREVQENGVDFIYPDNLTSAMELPAVPVNPEKIEIIKLLVYYLTNYDDFYDQVLSLFKINWKLLIDNQILSDINVR